MQQQLPAESGCPSVPGGPWNTSLARETMITLLFRPIPRRESCDYALLRRNRVRGRLCLRHRGSDLDSTNSFRTRQPSALKLNSQVPACVLSCYSASLASSSCTATDPKCLCTSDAFKSAVGTCFTTTCVRFWAGPLQGER